MSATKTIEERIRNRTRTHVWGALAPDVAQEACVAALSTYGCIDAPIAVVPDEAIWRWVGAAHKRVQRSQRPDQSILQKLGSLFNLSAHWVGQHNGDTGWSSEAAPHAATAASRDELTRVIEHLTESERILVKSLHMDGDTNTKIANREGCAVSTITRRVLRLKDKVWVIRMIDEEMTAREIWRRPALSDGTSGLSEPATEVRRRRLLAAVIAEYTRRGWSKNAIARSLGLSATELAHFVEHSRLPSNWEASR